MYLPGAGLKQDKTLEVSSLWQLGSRVRCSDGRAPLAQAGGPTPIPGSVATSFSLDPGSSYRILSLPFATCELPLLWSHGWAWLHPLWAFQNEPGSPSTLEPPQREDLCSVVYTCLQALSMGFRTGLK